MRKTNTLLCLEHIKPIFLSIALKQTKAGSAFLVYIKISENIPI